jgi:hypothetical protein
VRASLANWPGVSSGSLIPTHDSAFGDYYPESLICATPDGHEERSNTESALKLVRGKLGNLLNAQACGSTDKLRIVTYTNTLASENTGELAIIFAGGPIEQLRKVSFGIVDVYYIHTS